ncbi:glucose 1-dehydrogenase [archaeon]|jgi:glucose 1-dehydrogenase|nr:glucose 1-dehydrogenase [archaeon]MBT4397526.1 glucose 1-dehydrogenase [archaeon]MBT4440783.1 glucose 1-dehydrogenase [archaeon]
MDAICIDQHLGVHLRELDMPKPNPDQVLVSMRDAGVCGTDHEIIERGYGSPPEGDDYAILGHESLGQIVDIGEDVSIFKEGDYVVRTVRRPCSSCVPCDQGSNDLCDTGDFTEVGIKGIHGVMVDYFVEHPDYLVRVPEEHRDVAVLLEPLSVVEKAFRVAYEKQGRVPGWYMGEALVVGAGPIGLLQAMILRANDVNTSVVARSPRGNLKSEIVGDIGATYYSTEEGVPAGDYDFIFDASGSSKIAFSMMDNLAPNGVLCWNSITAGKTKSLVASDRINLDWVLNNNTLFGAVNANIRDYETGVRRFDTFENKWPGLLGGLITRRIPIEEFEKAFERDRQGIKTVIEF